MSSPKAKSLDAPQNASQGQPKEQRPPAPAPPAPEPHLNRQQIFQILSTFIVFFNTWGILLTFGAFQTYYEKTLLRHESSSTISWIASTGAFIVLSAGIFTGPLYDQGFYRSLVLFGSVLEVFGIMMISLSATYYQIFLSQAVCVGLGAGIVFTPSLAAAAAALPTPATRARAMGLMAAGSSIGGIVYPIMFRYLISQVGFSWTVRSIGFVVFALYLVSYLSLIRRPPQPSVVRKLFDKSALTDLPWMVVCGLSILSCAGYYIPLLYLPLLTEVRVPYVSQDFGFNLLAIVNGSSFVGRLVAGILAAKVGPTETVAACNFISATIIFSWIAVKSVAGTVVWAVFWGLSSGVQVALPGAVVPLFCPSIAVLGTRNGMYWVFAGLGMLIGSPVAGAIYDPKSNTLGYWHLEFFAGIITLVAGIILLYPIAHLRKKATAIGKE